MLQNPASRVDKIKTLSLNLPAMRRSTSRPPAPAFLRVLLFALLPLLSGCDQVAELLELPNPARDAARAEAECRAIGSACRRAGRSLEDCYALNGSADKAAIFAGWRDMNDYMMEHKLEVVPSRLLPDGTPVKTPPPADAG